MKLKRKLEDKFAPHWFHQNSSKTIIWKSSLPLIPLIIALLVFDFKATFGNLFLSVAAGFGFEYLFRKCFGTKSFYSDGDVFTISLLLVPLLPTPFDPTSVLNAVFFASVIGRLVFGGRGEAIFYAVPLGVLGVGLWLSSSASIELYGNWMVLAAVVLGAIILVKIRMCDYRMAVIFLMASVSSFLILNQTILLSQLTVLVYFSFWVLSDSPKPMSKSARLWFALSAGIFSGFFSLKVNFICAASLSLLFGNLFIYPLDEYFGTKRNQVVL